MAIYIVDQFSLNTDLPLDIRYVPAGGSYLDVSGYWYPGMQVYQTDDQKIWYADNSLNWHQIGSGGSDGSINELYQFFNDLSTYVGQKFASVDASIIDLRNWDLSQDASIVLLNGWQLSQDASIVGLRNTDLSLDASIVQIRTDLGDVSTRVFTLEGWQLSQDASIVALRNTDLSQDSSIVALRNTDLSQDASIVGLRNTDLSLDASIVILQGWQLSQDASIVGLRNTDLSLDASIVILQGWQLSQDASIENIRTDIETSLGLYVKKAGDTMSGPLTISAGGLQVQNDVSIYGDLYVAGSQAIGGNLTINGSLFVIGIESIDVSSAFIQLNTGLTGAPPPTLQSGIIVNRGTSAPYIFVYDEDIQTFRIGISQLETSTHYSDASTQAVATRQDSPIANGIAYWNNTAFRFDTSSALTFNGELLTLDGSLRLLSYGGASDLMLVVEPDGTVKTVAITADTSVLGAINIGDGSAGVYAGITNDGSLQFRRFKGIGAAQVVQNGDIIEISINASYGGEVNTASNVLGGDASIFLQKNGTDLQFRSIKSLDPTQLIITNDASFVYIDVSISSISDASINDLYSYIDGSLLTRDSSIEKLFGWQLSQDASIVNLQNKDLSLDASIVALQGWQLSQDASIINLQNKDLSLDASIVALDARLDLVEASVSYLDSSIQQAFQAIENVSLGGLADVSLSSPLLTHQIIEYDASLAKWRNTSNLFWDISLGTTTDDLGGVPQGTNLNGLTLKQVLYKILYEYQIPTLLTGTNPLAGIYEKGLVSTQFASIDVSWYATNFNYPLALLNNVHITKTGVGSIFDASLGLVATNASTYTDATGILNWGGTNRTITYNVTIDDDQADQSQPAVGLSNSFTFYYRQYWGEVPGITNAVDVNSAMILALDSSRLAGESDLTATFTYTGGAKIKYLFAYPDTIGSPDNFSTLSQILDQNDFDITSSWDTENEDVSVGLNNVRYRFYLLKNKVDTSTFDITFKF